MPWLISRCSAALLLMAITPVLAQAQPKCWVQDSLHRVFPTSPPGETTSLDLLTARNARVSFQACARNPGTGALDLKCSISGADDLSPLIRRVGYMPMPHHTVGTAPEELDGIGRVPGLVPDPLFPESTARVGPLENQSFWITLTIPADAKPGTRQLKVRVNDSELTVNLQLASLVIQPRKDFPVTHWWRSECLWDWYKTGTYEDERHWELTRTYLKNIRAHGSDVIYVPLFFMRRETFQRPAQLLIVNRTAPDTYTFDFTQVSRFLTLARECGFEKFEWSHLWIYWGVENAIRVYTKTGDKMEMLWPPTEPATGPTYTKFLQQFLPAFHDFLVKEKALDNSYFHLSDEPGEGQHVENYRKARQLLRDLAPWMKVMDALSDVRYGREKLTDIPIPIVSAAQPYIDEKIPHWVYYCCAPTGPWLNRFCDTPLAKIRMSGFLFYKLRARGFLHWGYNYWHRMEQEKLIDPFTELSGGDWPGIPAGDPFVVYPGKDGPIDSIRWEVFAESLQDYAMLQSAGISPDDPMLGDIKSYKDFPKSSDWLNASLKHVLTAPAK